MYHLTNFTSASSCFVEDRSYMTRKHTGVCIRLILVDRLEIKRVIHMIQAEISYSNQKLNAARNTSIVNICPGSIILHASTKNSKVLLIGICVNSFPA